MSPQTSINTLYAVFPQMVCALKGFLTYGRSKGPVLDQGAHRRVRQIPWPLQDETALKVQNLLLACAPLVPGDLVSEHRRFAWYSCRFRPASISGGRRSIFSTFGALEPRFAWQVQYIGHFFIRVAGVAFRRPSRNVGRRGSFEACLKWCIFVAGAVNLHLGRCCWSSKTLVS